MVFKVLTRVLKGDTIFRNVKIGVSAFVDRRQFCRCIIGVSGVPRGPYCMCKTKMAACALRIKCCVLESCCSFDGSFPSRSTLYSTFIKIFSQKNLIP